MRYPASKSFAAALAVVLLFAQSARAFPSEPAVRKTTVIHIHDIHGNFEAQIAIGEKIERLLREENIGLVALEGAFEPIDLGAFRSFLKRAAVRDVAGFLLKENEISGPIHAALTVQQRIPPFVGVDNRAQYNANVRAYRRAAPLAAQAKRRIHLEGLRLERIKSAVFNKDLAAADKEVSAYHQGKTDLANHVRKLSMQTGNTTAEIKKFLLIMSLESVFDFRRTPPDASQAMAFHRYAELRKSLDREKLLSDVAELEEAVLNSKAETMREKTLLLESKRTRLMGKLTSFSLSAPEWESFKTFGVDLPPFTDFYRAAEARDESLAGNFLQALGKTRARTAIIVTGGFHSRGIDERLAKAGHNVVSFIPNIAAPAAANGSGYLSKLLAPSPINVTKTLGGLYGWNALSNDDHAEAPTELSLGGRDISIHVETAGNKATVTVDSPASGSETFTVEKSEGGSLQKIGLTDDELDPIRRLIKSMTTEADIHLRSYAAQEIGTWGAYGYYAALDLINVVRRRDYSMTYAGLGPSNDARLSLVRIAMEDSRVIRQLIWHLNDGSNPNRQAFALALKEISQEKKFPETDFNAAIEAFSSIFENSTDIPYAYLNTLIDSFAVVGIGHPATAAVLWRITRKHPDPKIRQEARQKIKLQGFRGYQFLNGVTTDNREESREVEELIQDIAVESAKSILELVATRTFDQCAPYHRLITGLFYWPKEKLARRWDDLSSVINHAGSSAGMDIVSPVWTMRDNDKDADDSLWARYVAFSKAVPPTYHGFLNRDSWARDRLLKMEPEEIEKIFNDIRAAWEDWKTANEALIDSAKYTPDQAAKTLELLLRLELLIPGRAKALHGFMERSETPAQLLFRYLDKKRIALSDNVPDMLEAILGRLEKKFDPTGYASALDLISQTGTLVAVDLLREFAASKERDWANPAKTLQELKQFFITEINEGFFSDLGINQVKTEKLAMDYFFAPFVTKLDIAHKSIKTNHPAKLPLFTGLIRALVTENFWGFIENERQEDEAGMKIAAHNKEIRLSLGKLGIDVEKWLGKNPAARLEPRRVESPDGEKKFLIRPIYRTSPTDIFLGDFTKCCLAMSGGESHAITWVQRLIDEGSNAIEVINLEDGLPYAFASLYITEEGGLAIQSLEITPHGTKSDENHLKILSFLGREMIDYSRDFAKFIGAKRLYVAKKGNTRKFFNDKNMLILEEFQNKLVPFGLEKVGGFLGGTEYMYTAGGFFAYLVWESEPTELTSRRIIRLLEEYNEYEEVHFHPSDFQKIIENVFLNLVVMSLMGNEDFSDANLPLLPEQQIIQPVFIYAGRIARALIDLDKPIKTKLLISFGRLLAHVAIQVRDVFEKPGSEDLPFRNSFEFFNYEFIFDLEPFKKDSSVQKLHSDISNAYAGVREAREAV